MKTNALILYIKSTNTPRACWWAGIHGYTRTIFRSPGTEPENGTLVDVVSPKGAYLGTGFLSLQSKIRVRLISRNANDTFDAAFWRRRVEYAWAYRKTVLEPADLSACRFIFGEADQFPGLTVDRFNNVLVTQTLSVGMEKLKPVLFPLLAEVLRADGQTIDGIYERNDEALRAKEGLEQNKGWFALPGESHPHTTQTEICENGVYYHVTLKTAKNRLFPGPEIQPPGGGTPCRRAHRAGLLYPHRQLCLNAAKGGAARVTAADISAEAIAMAKRNAERNGLDNMDFLCEDTFALLPRLEKEGHPYDFIILDPPAFTKARRTVENAMRGYKEINYRAMKLLPRGGYLATASCSHFATEELFIKMLRAAAKDAHRQLRQIEVKQQAPDHPILWGVPETNYLKFSCFRSSDDFYNKNNCRALRTAFSRRKSRPEGGFSGVKVIPIAVIPKIRDRVCTESSVLSIAFFARKDYNLAIDSKGAVGHLP